MSILYLAQPVRLPSPRQTAVSQARTQSNSSRRGRGTSRFGKSLCISHALQLLRRPDKLIRECRAKLLEREVETKDRRVSPNRQFAQGSRPPTRKSAVKFLIRCADVDLQMFVADAASDVASEFVAAEFSRRVTVHEADFAAGPCE